MANRKRSIRLFRVAGIDVFLHWSWVVVALFEISARRTSYDSFVWNAAEYLALFAIVTAHEFGHAFACRSVGGRADTIVLWPLGGVAFVQPPERPGAHLWSLAAGPLVNVALLPLLGGLYWMARDAGWRETSPHAYEFVRSLLFMDIGMFVFNVLPIYPLDGGQMLRAVLWWFLGPIRSLRAAAIVGTVGCVGLLVLAFAIGGWRLGAIALFALVACLGGIGRAQQMARIASAPRRDDHACPSCGAAPPVGAFWRCGGCRTVVDAFDAGPVCLNCSRPLGAIRCPACSAERDRAEWTRTAPQVEVPAGL